MNILLLSIGCLLIGIGTANWKDVYSHIRAILARLEKWAVEGSWPHAIAFGAVCGGIVALFSLILG